MNTRGIPIDELNKVEVFEYYLAGKNSGKNTYVDRPYPSIESAFHNALERNGWSDAAYWLGRLEKQETEGL